MRYFFIAVICIFCIVAFVGCASQDEPDYDPAEDYDLTEYEDLPADEDITHYEPVIPRLPAEDYNEYEPLGYDDYIDYERELFANEVEFLARLSYTGLDWDFSERQRELNIVFEEDNRLYLIICRNNLVGATIIARSNVDENQNMLYIGFFLDREPTDDELTVLQQSGLLTTYEWASFWELFGIMLDKTDELVIIAELVAAYMEDTEKEPDHHDLVNGTVYSVYLLEGTEGAVEYRVVLYWNPDSEIYSATIDLYATINS